MTPEEREAAAAMRAYLDQHAPPRWVDRLASAALIGAIVGLIVMITYIMGL